MEQVFNKLVRDKIPDKIKSNGEVAVTRVLDDDEYRKELFKKLLEEANEVINSSSKEEALEELADVLEVIKSIGELNNFSLENIIDAANKKRLSRGGFKKRMFLELTRKKNEE